MWSPLQLMHLKEWGHSKPLAVSRHGGLSLGFALQHPARFLWCSSLWGPLHFWHLELCALQEKVEWPHFQQLWHWGMPGFMLVALMVAICLPRLKKRLIRSLAFEPFWVSQMSNQIMAISNLGEALMILGLAAREMFSKSSMCFIKSVTLSLEILFSSERKYGMPVIFR